MKKISKAILAILALAVIAAVSPSCSRFGKSKGQSTEFATFIKAYTGGIISDNFHPRDQGNSQMAYPEHDRVHTRERRAKARAGLHRKTASGQDP